ncbi:MAG: hypothetical protein EPO20_10025 [Betaproteobacteria bacterium]|nr:MAG: hypothetical protein EPO20_10025 [Betaproteobacteria bacterium]
MQLTALQRPRLELSGPKLSLALETLVARSEEQGGVEAYIEALRVKSAMFRDARGAQPDLKKFKTLCAHMATVRRRIGPYLLPERYDALARRVAHLFQGSEDASTADARMAEFCAAFPQDREHRWVRDLAAELLHFADPERYPLMTRWVWDAEANTGVLREIWHGEEVDHLRLDVPDGYAAFLVLREELAQYLAANGVYRDTLFYVDVLAAQVYAGYIGERAGSYLRVDFSSPMDPMEHTRRILGLEGVDDRGRTRLKSVDGRAEVIE